jgi:hypothetical protein
MICPFQFTHIGRVSALAGSFVAYSLLALAFPTILFAQNAGNGYGYECPPACNYDKPAPRFVKNSDGSPVKNPQDGRPVVALIATGSLCTPQANDPVTPQQKARVCTLFKQAVDEINATKSSDGKSLPYHLQVFSTLPIDPGGNTASKANVHARVALGTVPDTAGAQTQHLSKYGGIDNIIFSKDASKWPSNDEAIKLMFKHEIAHSVFGLADTYNPNCASITNQMKRTGTVVTPVGGASNFTDKDIQRIATRTSTPNACTHTLKLDSRGKPRETVTVVDTGTSSTFAGQYIDECRYDYYRYYVIERCYYVPQESVHSTSSVSELLPSKISCTTTVLTEHLYTAWAPC